MKDKEKPIGLDLVDGMPVYGKSLEENQEILKQRYLKVYGEYPPALDESKKE